MSKLAGDQNKSMSDTANEVEAIAEPLMVEMGRVSDTKGGFGPFPDPGNGGTFFYR